MDLLTAGQFVGGVVALIVGARMLVHGAAKLAVTIGVPPLVIGLTVVAFGTGSPELAVTLRASLTGDPGQADIGVGNVVGSNIANILFVLGLSALITPLAVRARLVRWDVPVMIGVSALLMGLAWDGQLSRVDGAILFGGIVLYTVVSVVAGRRSSAREKQAAVAAGEEIPEEPAHGPGQVILQVVLIAAGLAILVVGADQLVQAATKIAAAFGVSQLVIGLTVVAIGTSLPEAATSLVAGIRGERDIALGNAVGSNIFNILAVLGISGLLAPEGVSVAPGAISFDMPVMIAVAVACLPVVFTGGKIARWEGLLFLGYYAAYIGYLFVSHTHESLIPEFNAVMLAFVIPLTVLGLGLAVARAVKTGRTTRALQMGGGGDGAMPTASSDGAPAADLDREARPPGP